MKIPDKSVQTVNHPGNEQIFINNYSKWQPPDVCRFSLLLLPSSIIQCVPFFHRIHHVYSICSHIFMWFTLSLVNMLMRSVFGKQSKNRHCNCFGGTKLIRVDMILPSANTINIVWPEDGHHTNANTFDWLLSGNFIADQHTTTHNPLASKSSRPIYA